MGEKLSILLCEDDENLGMLLREYLQAKGYSTELFPDGEAGYKAFLKNKYDLCVLDVMMPKKNGYQVLKQIRKDDPALPVIILSAKGSPSDVAMGLDLGSDDYLPKPFDSEVLISRINAIFRRLEVMSRPNAPKAKKGFKFASYFVDEDRYMLVDQKNAEIPLTVREIDILRILSSNPDKVVTRDLLLNEVWKMEYTGSTRTLDQHIALLRKKLGKDDHCISSVRGAGYRYSTYNFS